MKVGLRSRRSAGSVQVVTLMAGRRAFRFPPAPDTRRLTDPRCPSSATECEQRGEAVTERARESESERARERERKRFQRRQYLGALPLKTWAMRMRSTTPIKRSDVLMRLSRSQSHAAAVPWKA